MAAWLGLRAGGPAPLDDLNSDATPPQASPITVETPNAEETAPSSPALAPGLEPSALDENQGRQRIEEWLSSSTDTSVITRHMLDGFGTLRPEDHLLAAKELVNLVGDADYADLQRLLLNPTTSLEAKELMFQDALNRQDLVKLPLLLAILQQPGHPLAAAARERLVQALGEDFGDDASRWQQAINAELRRQ